MPIYQYKCSRCDNRLERRQSINAEPLKVCPMCGANIDKIISNVNFVIKDGGTRNKKYNDGLDL